MPAQFDSFFSDALFLLECLPARIRAVFAAIPPAIIILDNTAGGCRNSLRIIKVQSLCAGGVNISSSCRISFLPIVIFTQIFSIDKERILFINLQMLSVHNNTTHMNVLSAPKEHKICKSEPLILHMPRSCRSRFLLNSVSARRASPASSRVLHTAASLLRICRRWNRTGTHRTLPPAATCWTHR